MTTEASLLAAVIAEPDGDLPRLVFADFLEEQGQSDRADFIRTSIAWAKMAHVRTYRGNWQKKQALEARAVELLRANLCVWIDEVFGPFDQWDLGPTKILGAGVRNEFAWSYMYWSRGFVERIIISWLDWNNEFDGVKQCDRLRAATPLRKVVLVEAPRPVAVRAAGPFGGWGYSGDAGVGIIGIHRDIEHARIAFGEHIRFRWPGIDFEIEEAGALYEGTVSRR